MVIHDTQHVIAENDKGSARLNELNEGTIIQMLVDGNATTAADASAGVPVITFGGRAIGASI